MLDTGVWGVGGGQNVQLEIDDTLEKYVKSIKKQKQSVIIWYKSDKN